MFSVPHDTPVLSLQSKIHYTSNFPNLSAKPLKIIYLQQKIFASVCLAGWVSGSAAAVWSPDVTAARWAAADHLCSTQQVQWPAGAVTSVHPGTEWFKAE